MDTALSQILNRLFSWKHNSLAAYIAEARPFVKPEQTALMEAVRQCAEEDRMQTEFLSRTIEEMGEVPRIAAHDPMVSELNYLAIDFLGKVLVSDLRRQAGEIEAALGEGGEDADARSAVREILAAIQTQIRRLENAPLEQPPV